MSDTLHRHSWRQLACALLISIIALAYTTATAKEQNQIKPGQVWKDGPTAGSGAIRQKQIPSNQPTDDKVETIANAIGYESPFTFSNAFKRWTGRRPTDYGNGGKGG